MENEIAFTVLDTLCNVPFVLQELDGRVPRAKERTIMFDSTDTLSAVSADGSVREAAVEAPAATFYIGDTPITRGKDLMLKFIQITPKSKRYILILT